MKKPSVLLFFIASLSAKDQMEPPPFPDTNEYKILFDIDFSPWAGGEDLLFTTRGFERVIPKILGDIPPFKDLKLTFGRLSQMVSAWLPLNYLAVVTQHEIFGHGYRIRDLSDYAKVTGYSIGTPPPYGAGGGGTNYIIDESGITITELCSIASAGVEATAILANLTKFKWIKPRKIDPKQTALYLLAQHDISNYIGSMKIIRKHAYNPHEHDINAYLFYLNATYPASHMSSSRLRSLCWVNIIDPFTFYSIGGWFYYLATGKSMKIPMIPLSQGVRMLFGTRLGLTPFGPELYFENYFSAGGKCYYGYLRLGKHAHNNYDGCGAILPLSTSEHWNLGLTLNIWRQPKLLLHLNSSRHSVSYGISGSLSFDYHWMDTFGGEIQFGWKTEGFLPGYSLFESPIIRGGLLLYF